MVYELADTAKVTSLFEGWPETLIWSCLQKVMGKIYVTDLGKPRSALAFIGCFVFYGGEPERELVMYKPAGFVIMTPQNEAWASLIEECRPSAKKETRFLIRKDTRFDIPALKKMAETIPECYELRKIDAEIYDQCLADPLTRDFGSCFKSKEQYLEPERGMVLLKSGRIVSGASSYTRYGEGVEIEVDTVSEERRKALLQL